MNIAEASGNGKSAIKILVNFANYLYSEALKGLLINKQNTSQRLRYIVECSPPNEQFVPDIILTDFYSLDQKLLSMFPDARVLLVDTGLELEVIASVMFSHKIDGLLSIDTDVEMLKKALAVVSSGKIWLDNKRVKAFLRKAGMLPKKVA